MTLGSSGRNAKIAAPLPVRLNDKDKKRAKLAKLIRGMEIPACKCPLFDARGLALPPCWHVLTRLHGESVDRWIRYLRKYDPVNYGTRPLPACPSPLLKHDDRVNLYIERAREGVALFHPRDLCVNPEWAARINRKTQAHLHVGGRGVAKRAEAERKSDRTGRPHRSHARED